MPFIYKKEQIFLHWHMGLLLVFPKLPFILTVLHFNYTHIENLLNYAQTEFPITEDNSMLFRSIRS